MPGRKTAPATIEPELAVEQQEPEQEPPPLPTESVPEDLLGTVLSGNMDEYATFFTWVTTFVSEHFTVGVDYGPTTENAKATLLKNGAQKLMTWLKVRAAFEADLVSSQIAGPGVFCYRARLIYGDGRVVAEGTGAYDLNEDTRTTINAAIKIAEKRAVVDAVLWMVPGLSEMFTQDMADIDEQPLLNTDKPAAAIRGGAPQVTSALTAEEEWERFGAIRRANRMSDEDTVAFIERFYPGEKRRDMSADKVAGLVVKLKAYLEGRQQAGRNGSNGR